MDNTKILEKIEQAKELYEDGAILEMRDLLSEIIDDIRNGVIIIRNKGGYFGTEPEEVFPSAQPERKKGKWIKEYWNGEHTRKCSACDITQTVTTYRGKVNFNYCPYCGADMRGDSDV